ncbi:fungal-specific transcription factor domain-containing protein, partial [Xylariales sp. PMI_506]
VQAKAECTFDTVYKRGRVPLIPPVAESSIAGSSSILSDELLTPSSSPPVTIQQHSVIPTSSDTTQNPVALQSVATNLPAVPPPSANFAQESHQNSPEPSQTDLQGHYIGPSSGVSFLLRVQKRLHQAISFSDPSSIFTFGDAPLHDPSDFDPSFCMMLPKDDAQRLVDRYFDYAMPTYRFLHRPTIQQWFVEFYDTLGTMRDPSSAPAKTALLFMVLAQARVYMPENDKPGPSDLSARYYQAAEHLLTKERGSIRLTSVQARLLQCYYLLTRSRINHCWSLFGTVTRLALAIGLNRNGRYDASCGLSLVEVQSRRRTFWCAYTLDAYLSLSLGRPRSFHDEDIDTDLPACVEDDELMPVHAHAPVSSKGPSLMLAPIAHMKIARIICKLLRTLYSIKPISTTRRISLTQIISTELDDWRSELSWFLDADHFRTSFLVPIFQRQRNVLNLTYWHAVILTNRPFLLSNFEHSWQGRTASDRQSQHEESIQKCLAAAMHTVNAINDITLDRQMIPAFWITAYFAFNATIVLYIYVIQKQASPPSTYSEYFSAAIQCQSQISRIAEKASLSERYCLVLEELRAEALRQTKRVHGPTNVWEGLNFHGSQDGIHPALLPIDDSPGAATIHTSSIGDGTVDFSGMPPAAGFESTGWGQFASMISSGLGNLDMFFQNDSFQL